MDNTEFKYEDEYHDGELVYYDTYKGYTFYIVSFGTYPCVYVEVHHDVKKEDVDDYEWLRCHGGITYVRPYVRGRNFRSETPTIGADFDHVGDLNNIHTRFSHIKGHEWTHEELVHQAHEIIDQLDIYNL